MDGRDTSPASTTVGVAGPAAGVIARLASLQRSDGGWPYVPGQESSFTEPTCWTLLALHAAGGLTDSAAALGAAFVSSAQNAEGGVHPGTSNQEAGWCTTLAVFALAAIRREQAALERSIDWLLRFEGYHWPRRPDEKAEHDTALRGWPWVTGSHSWDEPTCYAIYALKKVGLGNHPRVSEAGRMILNRSLPSGGWNYGNTRVLGRELRAFPSTTGMALVALLGWTDVPQVQAGLGYLGRAFPRLHTPWALGWSVLAGRFHGFDTLGVSSARQVEQRVAACLQEQLDRGDRIRLHELALLALAAVPAGRLPFPVAFG